jgi:MFS family permease
VIGLLSATFLIRNDAEAMSEEVVPEKTVIAADNLSLGDAVRSQDFWLYTVSFALIIFAVVGCNFHLPALLADHGAGSAQIASVVALGSAGSLFGRLFTGIMLDRYSVLRVAGAFFLGQVIGFFLLMNGLQWALLASFLLGAVQGAEIDVMGYVLARRFGRQAYARVFGMCFGITLVGAIFGPLAMAAIFDRTHSYDLGLLLLPFFPLSAFILLWLAKPLPKRARV